MLQGQICILSPILNVQAVCEQRSIEEKINIFEGKMVDFAIIIIAIKYSHIPQQQQ